jgi:preprotein translocase subunit SecA
MKCKRSLRKLNRILLKVKSYGDKMSRLSDEELSGMTAVFKERLSAGESLDDILPEAFAAVCEADRRILGKFPYDVQIMCGIALHQGYLTEMNTGEGKTLVATMPLYLNALTGKSCILVTTNEYLALRDSEEMGQVYEFMGLTISAGVRARADERISVQEKKIIYSADIVYTTHSALGFDYLINNLANSADERFMRELYYVIVDEADSVLLDSAQTPLVISGSPRVQSNLYESADFFVTTLTEGEDYETEDNKVWLTEHGIRYAEQFFHTDNFYSEEFFEINRYVTLALRAHTLFKREKEYMVSHKGEILLLDSGSGRMMPGVKLRGGQHQALEVKEKLKISQENRSVASITYQNLFLIFEKMSGMSGTISDARDELSDVYDKSVIIIPPNRPVQRKDLEDVFFQDPHEQVDTAVKKVMQLHEKGQPVLIVVPAIKDTEFISHILVTKNIPHSVLNANNAFWEADIIKEAGQKNAVTVATSMAGRGTDIKLGEGVEELGGLAVIGIGRMINIRQERQARGRAGRQGNPGMSQFFVCLHDEIVTNNGSKKIDKYIETEKILGKSKLKRLINNAQKKGEDTAVSSRKQSMDYDRVLKRQREIIYEMRNALLDGGTLDESQVMRIAKGNIKGFLDDKSSHDIHSVTRYILDNISYVLDEKIMKLPLNNRKELEAYLSDKVREVLHEQEKKLGKKEYFDEFIRISTLKAIDNAWVEQVDYLQQLQYAVTGRAAAQRNPIFEFQNEALESFHKMEKDALRNTMRNILLSDLYTDVNGQYHVLLP